MELSQLPPGRLECEGIGASRRSATDLGGECGRCQLGRKRGLWRLMHGVIRLRCRMG